jgi:hypothetical protein
MGPTKNSAIIFQQESAYLFLYSLLGRKKGKGECSCRATLNWHSHFLLHNGGCLFSLSLNT